FQAEDGIRARNVTGVQTCALPICSSKNVICELLKVDESNTIAHAIAYKSQELLIEDLMSSGRINRFTQLSKEHLWGKRNHFRKRSEERRVGKESRYRKVK